MSAAIVGNDTLAPPYRKENGVVGFLPRHGGLRPLKTCLETQALNQTVEAHVVEIPTRSANTVLRALQEVLPERDAINFQHLRRFAKPGFSPEQLSLSLSSTIGDFKANNGQKNSFKSEDQDQPADTPCPEAHDPAEPNLHLLVCAASIIPSPDLASILSHLHPFTNSQTKPTVRTIPVPLLPPTSDDQAALWSRQYWPTVYKRNNPFGPQPSLVSRAEAEIRPRVDAYMTLAMRVGREVQEMALGEAIGAVIVERKADVPPVVLAVAGDARWRGCGRSGEAKCGNGNVMAHAVMRAIGMIARKRREVAGTLARQACGPDAIEKNASATSRDDVFADWPLCQLESAYYANPITPNGYLCLDLELYISHEPCVMCSMAINHSRFGRVVFGKRIPRSGGLTSELQASAGPSPAEGAEEANQSGETCGSPGLGYGLFWRPGLNWKLLAWQWVAQDGAEADDVQEDVHA